MQTSTPVGEELHKPSKLCLGVVHLEAWDGAQSHATVLAPVARFFAHLLVHTTLRLASHDAPSCWQLLSRCRWDVGHKVSGGQTQQAGVGRPASLEGAVRIVVLLDHSFDQRQPELQVAQFPALFLVEQKCVEDCHV